jgi:hypothetical protein
MSQNVAIQRIKLVSKYAGNFCARILTDITISDILTTYDFPGQIVRIHYENLAFYRINNGVLIVLTTTTFAFLH